MISKLKSNYKFLFKSEMNENRMLIAYRYISLVITSLFYLLIHADHAPTRKIIIIGCLFFSSIILSYLYPNYKKSDKNIMILLVIEIVGNVILIVPSGGIRSPFIWYSLNVALISSVYLKKKHYWTISIICFLAYGVLSELIINNDINIIQFIRDEANLILSFIMMAVSIYTLTYLIKKTGEVTQKFLITEEQNRIANEIHDSVLQRLFSISCGMFSLTKKIDESTDDEIVEEINQFRKAIDITMKELRNKIYGLSWEKSGYSSFSSDIKQYIEDIKRFNKVNIPFSVIGDMECLSAEVKKAFYRIICEGIANAVRHGKAKNIDVILNICQEEISLKIVDDGSGFDLIKARNSCSRGLGLENIYQLTENIQGNIKIETNQNKGTKIEIVLPVNYKKGEKAL